MPVSANQTTTLDGNLTFAINLWARNFLADAFLGNNPAFVRMKQRGTIVTGELARQIVEPFMFPQAGGPEVANVADEYQDLTFLPMQGESSSYWVPCQKAFPLSVTEYDMVTMTGPKVEKVRLVESHMKKAFLQFFANLNGDFWAAEGATGSAGDRTHLASIRTLLNRGGTLTTATVAPVPRTEQLYNGNTQPGGAAVGTSPVTLVGGIERNAAENGYFCTPVKNPASAETLTLQTWNSLISLATRNKDKPDVGFIWQDGFDKLVTILQGAGYANLWEVDDVMKDFSGFTYRGVDTVFDDSVPYNGTTSFQAFLLNTGMIKLRCKSIEPQMQRKSDAKRLIIPWILSWYGCFTSPNLGHAGHARHAKYAV